MSAQAPPHQFMPQVSAARCHFRFTLLIVLFLPGTGCSKVVLSLRLFFGLRTKWPLIGAFCYLFAAQVAWLVFCQYIAVIYTV